MIDRRAFVALTASIPFASPLPRLDLPDPRHSALNTEGVRLLGISPDASVLVGTRNREQISFLDAETRFPISESEALPEVALIDESSVAWSPDGSKFAFSLNAWVVMRDSDIFVVDVFSGEVSNVTPEGHDREADSLLDMTDVQVDMYPVWLDDTTLLFARHENFPPDSGDMQTRLVSLNLETGEVQPCADLTAAGIRYVAGPMIQPADEWIIFTGDDAENEFHLFSAAPDGTIATIDTGELRTFRLVDANETHAVVIDPASFETWYVSLHTDEAMVPLWEHFELPESTAPMSNPVLGPEPHDLAVILRTQGENPSLYRFSDRESKELAQLVGDADAPVCHWAEDQILVTSRKDSWLVDL